MDYIWEWFTQVKGSNDITNNEILSWSILYGVQPEPREVELLKEMDSLIRRVHNV